MLIPSNARSAIRSWYRRAYARVSPNGEYTALPLADQAVIDGLVMLVRERHRMQSITHHKDGREFYAYPSGEGRVSWGVNDPLTGYNVSRGVFPAETEVAS